MTECKKPSNGVRRRINDSVNPVKPHSKRNEFDKLIGPDDFPKKPGDKKTNR